MTRRHYSPGIQQALARIDAALACPGDDRLILALALHERAGSEAEKHAALALYDAMAQNVAFNCDADAMRHAAMTQRDCAEALAAELEQAANYAECGEAMAREAAE